MLSLALGVCAGFALNPWQSVPAENPSAAPEQPEEALTPDEDTLIQETVASMTLYEKICQLLIVEPEHLTGEAVVTSAGEAMQTALAGMPVCGIMYSEENLKDKAQVQSMLAVAMRCPNVYLVPDCYVYIDCMPFADTYIEAANSFLKYRTIFGSTYPERSLKQTIEGWKKRPWDPGSP